MHTNVSSKEDNLCILMEILFKRGGNIPAKYNENIWKNYEGIIGIYVIFI